MHTSFRLLLSIGISLLSTLAACADDPIDYVKHVKPILARHCYECHNAKVQKGGLRLDSAALLFKGGDSGSPVVAGKAKKSLLVDVLSSDSVYPRMPYKRTPLTKKEIQLLSLWIEQGAKAPSKETIDVAKHWSFQPPVRHPLPRVQKTGWIKNPIDNFVLARLEQTGLSPSPEADKVTLMRRVYLDLIGLPPSIEEIDAFLNDERPDAYERLVDQLLNSPHYGERWGRHWLDLARYADSNGFTIDGPREIWKYRDWVIEALNKDMPFNQFVIEQIAGDMLPNATISQKIATGFHRNTLINQEGGIDREQFRVESVVDRVNTTGVVFLGLTLGCAQCHDHKYDPISQKEYYQLFAFLNNQSEPKLSLSTPALVAKREAILDKIEKVEIDLDKKINQYLDNLPEKEQKAVKNDITMILRLRVDQRTSAQKRKLAKFFRPKNAELKKGFDQIDALKKQLPDFPTTMVLRELSKPRQTHVHIKGDFTRKGEKVYPDVPDVLHSLERKSGGEMANRLNLAHWLVDPANPLVGRVTMNRIWQRYFGKGIVETENDFGTQGSAPTHPKLLDWLATELIRRNWSLKEMHRLIVTSATYRQSSKVRPELEDADPYNKLLGRQQRLRIDAEIIRDCTLAVSGLLSRKVGGPSVYPPQPKGIYAFTQVKRQWNLSKGRDRYRRGIYTFFQRSAPYPALIVFDAPNANSSCTRRVRSNTPLQALTLLNDKAFMELAQGLSDRILKEAPKNDRGRLIYAFRVCLARRPSPFELQRLQRFLGLQHQQYEAEPSLAKALLANGKSLPAADSADLPPEITISERAAWIATARVLLNLDEFITRE